MAYRRTGSRPTPSDPVIGPVPLDEARNPDLYPGRRRITQVALDRADIGIGVAHVAGLHRQQPALGLSAAGLLEQVDHVGQLLGAVVADIVEPVRALAAAGLLQPVVGRRIV